MTQNVGFEEQVTVYRSFTLGTLAQIVVTDERLYRDGPPCGSTTTDRYFTNGCGAQSNSGRTMLGATQKSWFQNEILGSAATWKLWANEVMLAQYKYGVFDTPVAVYFDLDAWDGYQAERRSLLTSFEKHGVKNFVALSGDAHLFMASYLKTDFDSLLESPMGVEFLTGPISSGNYLDSGVDFPDAPASSPGAARRLRELHGIASDDSLEPVVLTSNPHMKFWNGSSWGYSTLAITPQKLVCTFKSVSTVKQPSATLSELASFSVPAGKVQID